MQIFTCSTWDSITLYWEKDVFPVTITLNDKELSPSSTHCTFSDLQPDTEYSFTTSSGTTVKARTLLMPVFHDVTAYGVVGDGNVLNTAALQKAIDACGKGEAVCIPAGTFLTGALWLHSDMALYLEEGAVLQGSAEPADYLPKIPSRFEGNEMECYQSLLNLGTMDHTAGPNAGNVLICGKGTICGGGQKLGLAIIETEKQRLAEFMAANPELVASCENNNTLPGRARGRLINLSNCENVRITGLTLREGASWNVHMVYSKNIVTDHCAFWSEGVWNGDGWDPDSSEDCTLFASEFHTGDDGVAIKSGKNPDGNIINRPTKHIRIFDCTSYSGHGIAIGSEMSGGVEDVCIWDCDLRNSLYGVLIKGTKKRGGYIRNIRVQSSILPRFTVCAVPYNDDGEGAPVPPIFEDFLCKDVTFTAWARDYWEPELHHMPCVVITGFDVPGHEVNTVGFLNCVCEQSCELQLTHAKNIVAHIDQL